MSDVIIDLNKVPTLVGNGASEPGVPIGDGTNPLTKVAVRTPAANDVGSNGLVGTAQLEGYDGAHWQPLLVDSSGHPLILGASPTATLQAAATGNGNGTPMTTSGLGSVAAVITGLG